MNRGFSARVLAYANIGWVVVACGGAQTVPPRTQVSADQVLSEVARRSGLHESEVSALLADCNANQQSLYFCAYRDFVAADLALERVASSKLKKFPSCRAASPGDIENSRRSIDSECRKSAVESYGEGSMAPTAQATCAAIAMTALADEIAGSHDPTCAE
jgi:hypothetical protein